MSPIEMEYYLENLGACDPDYVVDVLEITSDELLAAFHAKAREFINTEHG